MEKIHVLVFLIGDPRYGVILILHPVSVGSWQNRNYNGMEVISAIIYYSGILMNNYGHCKIFIRVC